MEGACRNLGKRLETHTGLEGLCNLFRTLRPLDSPGLGPRSVGEKWAIARCAMEPRGSATLRRGAGRWESQVVGGRIMMLNTSGIEPRWEDDSGHMTLDTVNASPN